MNGVEKEEAQRPRPLSAGIWTLFSWLRRSERSSSSESISSVGSARTAVSFDFLAPGNCNFTNTPIVLSTALNPPTETYKKRLQERNLRRQRDRDVTLHRKYGLFREYGNGYDGFTLPSARRTNNTVDRPTRERRATSECLQRRAAYVPGKRRAPLPPAIATSASLPRTYKRKRPAPKPPVKNTFKENTVQLNSSPVRMSSNSESEAKYAVNNELFDTNKTQKCDKKMNSPRDTKSRPDRNFLKHIFENRKRSSVIETTSVKLLPSISELDKQAFEIIESNKLRQNKNNLNPDRNVLYDSNAWFCTTCLRKYNSSVDSCNYCLPDKGPALKKDELKMSSPRSSIYTQTNINIVSGSSSRSSVDERKMLKEILREMKDSLPKKNKDNKLNNIISENPTLKIGSTVEEAYKDLTSQPSSSSGNNHNKNRILSISSLLSETHRNYDRQNNTNQYITKSEMTSENQNKVTLGFENVSKAQSTPIKISLDSMAESSSANDRPREKNKNVNHSPILLSNKTKKYRPQEISTIKLTEDNRSSIDLKNTNNSQFTSINDSKERNNSDLGTSQDTSNNIHQQHFPKELKNLDNTSNVQNQTNISTKADQGPPKSTKLQFLNFPDSRGVVVNTATVVTSHLNKSSETSKIIAAQNIEKKSIQKQDETNVKGMQFQSPSLINSSPTNNVKPIQMNKQDDLKPKASLVKSPEIQTQYLKPEYNLHTPLNISSLLNPMSSIRTTVKENIRTENFASNQIPKEGGDTVDIDKAVIPVNEEAITKISPPLMVKTNSVLTTTCQVKDMTEPQIKESTTTTKNMITKDDQKSLPSTSRCFETETTNSKYNVNNYDQRRHLINQLEQSIAKGDEVAAAEAAVKLAKLRLSCSVLSFSSQIVGETSGIRQNEGKKHIPLTLEDKSLVVPQTHTETVNTSQQMSKNETVINLQKSKVLPEKEATELIKTNEPISQSHAFINESSSSKDLTSEDIVPINVWIEDKQAARGPIRLNISRRATMADLRRQAELSLGLATQLQRWIVGRTLCSDDATPIVSLAGPYFRAPFYLCIVQPDQKHNPVTKEIINDVTDDKNNSVSERNGEFYTELMKLEKQSLVSNIEPFECGVCMEECAAGAGVILRECIHTFCRDCLSDVVQHSQEPAVACPATGCSGFLQEREIRTIVTAEEYERWLARGLATAECGTRNAFHCRTRDCTGWAFCDPGVRRFPCPVCNKTNCVQCQAIHDGETCEQYQTKLREAVTAAETNKADEGTQALLNSLMSRGEALECPECKAIITKKWGCDWVKCSACKTEICWITKGRRWGPGGRGDTSGGCRCGVDGQRCHPSCGYCH